MSFLISYKDNTRGILTVQLAIVFSCKGYLHFKDFQLKILHEPVHISIKENEINYSLPWKAMKMANFKTWSSCILIMAYITGFRLNKSLDMFETHCTFKTKSWLFYSLLAQYHNTLLLPPQKYLHTHCFRFSLGHLHVQGEIANNHYAKFGG